MSHVTVVYFPLYACNLTAIIFRHIFEHMFMHNILQIQLRACKKSYFLVEFYLLVGLSTSFKIFIES